MIGGGAYIYRMALARDLVDRLYITRIHAEIDGDTFLPAIDFDDWELVSERTPRSRRKERVRVHVRGVGTKELISAFR